MKRALLLLTIAAISLTVLLGGCTSNGVPAVTPADAEFTADVVLENDWIFTTRSQKPLRVALANNGPAATVPVVLEITTDKGEAFKTLSRTSKLAAGGTDTLEFRMKLKPGFYKAHVSTPDSTLDKSFNIGCDPEAIVSPQDKQPDFDAFWQKAIDDLHAVEPDFKLTYAPEHSDEGAKSWWLDYESLDGGHVRGFLTIPTAEGRKFPVHVVFNGYTSPFWWSEPQWVRDRIEVSICTREQGQSRIEPYVSDWIRRGLSSPDAYYYRGAYMDCYRLVEFVKTLPEADIDQIYAEGASQGGALTLVTAALTGAFKCIMPMVPFMSDFPDYFKVADWPGNEILPQAAGEGIADEDLYRTLSYFDVKNFADRITCPTYMSFALQDVTCPPHTNFAGYNLIPAEKSWKCYPLSGHDIHNQEPVLSQSKNEFLYKHIKFD